MTCSTCQNEMNVDSAPKVYLQNRLAKCKEKLLELQPIIEAKREEFTHRSCFRH